MFDIKRRKKNKKTREDRKEKKISSVKNKRPRVFSFLIPAEEKEYFIENLSMLLSSGMDIITALQSIKKEVQSSQMKTVIDNLCEDVEAGMPIWKVLEETKFFPAFIISLIKIGESSGGLLKNLRVISIQQKKDRIFSSKIRSAMMYPVFVLALTLAVGISIAWFILPRLTLVFDQLKVELPLITRVLISFGNFISQYGSVAVPAFLAFVSLVIYFVFIFSRTKFIGQTLFFSFPGTRKLIQETELARMGYIMGTLLRAGLPLTEALDSLAEASNFYKYKNLYLFLKKNIEEGGTFQQGFEDYGKSKRLVPSTIQQMMIVGERSGRLSEMMISIGEAFEEKIDNTTKNLATILEPVLLVIVWLGVVSVALAVILPIYSLIGGLNKPKTVSAPPIVTTETVIISEQLPEADPGEVATATEEKKIEILKTGLGFLNVRDAGNTKGKIIGKVLPGEQYVVKNETGGWYEIILADGKTGWVINKYVKSVELPAGGTVIEN